MAVILDATVGGVAANTYVTEGEADAYFQARLHATTWPALTPDDKRRALAWATRLLESWITWSGSAATYTQRLAWPRYGCATVTGAFIPPTELPHELKVSVCELAWNLTQTDATVWPESVVGGLTSLTAGPVTLEWATGPTAGLTPSMRLLSPNVLGPIQRWVAETPGLVSGGGVTMVPLRRV
jgi:hypothetical protein